MMMGGPMGSMGGPMSRMGGPSMYNNMQGPYNQMTNNSPGYYNQSNNSGMYGGQMGPPMNQPPTPQPPKDEILIMVPNSAVGALIGAGGSHIKQIIRDSSAYVTVSKIQLLDLNICHKFIIKLMNFWSKCFMIHKNYDLTFCPDLLNKYK
jgi:hypothetical protein